ncbi:hypothetical protein HH213_28500 [Duganella dendranthematis]|uniref:Tn3 family transposase n=2 Tax=Duganella dendranthematis TaxID=2728021 RepID=A0ABX6MJH7_9BURK|nr:hypothetical protein HH213_28500 [Duganella dendranthematis]
MNVSLAQQSRHNEECSAVVNRGILVQSSFNTVCAIEYMKSHNVDPKVIERVLLHPDQRREVTH